MDKSSFLHHGTGIPVEIRPFFSIIESMEVGDKKEIKLTDGISDFDAHIEMINKKNPRTRLMWKSDFQKEIQTKFPSWVKYFKNHTKHDNTTPNLKLTKNESEFKYLISFEDSIKSSDSLELMKIYSREELKELFQITGASINNGIFKPKGTSSIWLFITENKTPDMTQYNDYFDGEILQFDGQKMGRTDNLIVNHQSEGNEIIVFYRKNKREYSNYGFKYLGEFYYQSHIPGEPTHFTLSPADVMSDDNDEFVSIDMEPSIGTEGKEKTRIQTYFERNPKLRKDAIAYHGTKCAACGFSFSEKYGDLGNNYIEIHHLKPHASIKGIRDIDPKTDLIPVCSNCHRMIHKSNPMLTIDELKKIIKK